MKFYIIMILFIVNIQRYCKSQNVSSEFNETLIADVDKTDFNTTLLIENSTSDLPFETNSSHINATDFLNFINNNQTRLPEVNIDFLSFLNLFQFNNTMDNSSVNSALINNNTFQADLQGTTEKNEIKDMSRKLLILNSNNEQIVGDNDKSNEKISTIIDSKRSTLNVSDLVEELIVSSPQIETDGNGGDTLSIVNNSGSSIIDTGILIVDSGTSIVNSGSSIIDSGTSNVDIGTSIVNSGSSIIDNGTSIVDTISDSSIINGDSPLIDSGTSINDNGSFIIDSGTSMIESGASINVEPTLNSSVLGIYLSNSGSLIYNESIVFNENSTPSNKQQQQQQQSTNKLNQLQNAEVTGDPDLVYFPEQLDYLHLHGERCNSKPNLVYFPFTDQCYEEGTQGPCHITRVIHFDKPSLRPMCKILPAE